MLNSKESKLNKDKKENFNLGKKDLWKMKIMISILQMIKIWIKTFK